MNESTITRKPALGNGKKIEKPKFYDKVFSLTTEESPFNLKRKNHCYNNPKAKPIAIAAKINALICGKYFV